MLKKKIETALNKQIVAEFYSSYLYLSMEAYFDSINLKGMASWMHVQALEETTHAMKIFNFINERGGRVTLGAIEKPPVNWKSPLAVFENSYKHEQMVTGLINNLADLAVAEKDHASQIFLQWFVTEQVEEEASAQEVVQKLKLLGDNPPALLMLDNELAARVFVPPATESEA